MSPSFKQEPYTNEAVARFTKKIEEGDAFVIVTPEYNHGTSGVLKNALDFGCIRNGTTSQSLS